MRVAFIALVLIVAGSQLEQVSGQEDYPFIDRAKTKASYSDDEKFTISVAGNHRDITKVWQSVLEKCRSQDTMRGRLILRQFPPNQWEMLSKLEEGVYPPNVAETYVVDFGCDYVDLQVRQDFCLIRELTPTEVDSQFSIKETPKFTAHTHPNTVSFEMFGMTPDYQLTRNNRNPTRIGLPQKSKRRWPNVVDLRTIGWFSFSQWMHPTNLEQWEHAMSVYTSFAIEPVEDGRTKISYFASGGPIMRVYYVDNRLKRVVKYIEYSVIPNQDPLTVECVKGKGCHNRLEYDERGNLKRFAFGSIGGVWRGDFVQLEVGEFIDDELLNPRSFHGGNSPLVIDDSIKDAYALLTGLGVPVDKENEVRK
jgi:hypothetical protein